MKITGFITANQKTSIMIMLSIILLLILYCIGILNDAIVYILSWVSIIIMASVPIICSMLLFISILLIYLLPLTIASYRKHNNILSIVLTNVFSGWSVIGWFISLIWACSDNIKQE